MARKELVSARGYNMYEVVSAFQKALRRSQIDDSLYWGAEGFKSGYENWMWKRLRIVISEDIGPAAPGLPADVQALYQTSLDMGKGKHRGQIMFFAHATVLAAQAPKSRITDWALFSVADISKPADREIPDYAQDMHTLEGKMKGRGAGHFVREAGKLEQPEWVQARGPQTYAQADMLRHLEALEHQYLDVFRSDQSRWRDPESQGQDQEESQGQKQGNGPSQQKLLPNGHDEDEGDSQQKK